MNFTQNVSEFYTFLTQPIFKYNKADKLGIPSLFSLYAFTFLVVILLSSPIMILIGGDEMPHAMTEMIAKFPKWQLFLLAVVVMPALEELFFRAHLKLTFWQKFNFGYPFYFTAALFAYAHLFNFSLDADKWFLGPLLIIPQLILGFFLGYIRVRNNIWTSIFFHSFHNGLAFTALMFAPEAM